MVLLILLFLFKTEPDRYLSKEIKSQTDFQVQQSTADLINSLCNYDVNQQNFKITFLEYGAKGNMACTKMEAVQQKTREVLHQIIR